MNTQTAAPYPRYPFWSVTNGHQRFSPLTCAERTGYSRRESLTAVVAGQP